jgi:hypothetical protein
MLWRMWDVAAIEMSAGVWQWRLKSPFAFTAWVPGIGMRAECSRCVSPPTRRCGCGIYESFCAIGQVAGWGRVVRHVKG